jgi:hypothetical protein
MRVAEAQEPHDQPLTSKVADFVSARSGHARAHETARAARPIESFFEKLDGVQDVKTDPDKKEAIVRRGTSWNL